MVPTVSSLLSPVCSSRLFQPQGGFSSVFQPWRPIPLSFHLYNATSVQILYNSNSITSETQLHSCTQVSRQEVQQTTICSNTFQSYQHQSTIAFQPVNILYHIVICVRDLMLPSKSSFKYLNHLQTATSYFIKDWHC